MGGALALDVYPSPAPSAFTLYVDLGEGFGYEAGLWARTALTLQQTPQGAVLRAERQGLYAPAARTLVVRVHRVDKSATAVHLSGQPLPKAASPEAALLAGSGYAWDADGRSLPIPATSS